MRKIIKAAGGAIAFMGFLAVWAGCEVISSCMDMTGGILVPLGLAGMIAGATMADAWYFPESDDQADKKPDQRSSSASVSNF